MSRLTFLVLSLLGLSMLTACNTWHGFGRDLTSAGKAITGEDEN
jgi:predicted small secreted protein